jgi:enamine deaminase RidA (YjgF/YER057c/UK114 family)
MGRKSLAYLALSTAIVSMGLILLLISGSARQSSQKGNVSYLNPEGLHRNPAYSQAVVVTGKAKTIYVGGQNAVDASGNIVGRGDIKAQTEQVYRNLETALAAGGARLEHVVKWNVYVVHGQPIEPGFEVFQKEWGNRPNPPVITMCFVSRLANPDFLIEMDAIAVVPEE